MRECILTKTTASRNPTTVVGVHAVGDLEEPAPFLSFKNIGVEYSLGINCLVNKQIPTTYVPKVAPNVIKTMSVDPTQQTWTQGLVSEPKMVSTPVQQLAIDLRFFVDASKDVDKRADQLRKILPPGFRVGVAHAEDLAKANVYLPKVVSAIQITNTPPT